MFFFVFVLTYLLTSYWFELNADSDPRFLIVKETVPSGFNCITRLILVNMTSYTQMLKITSSVFYCFYCIHFKNSAKKAI